MTVLVALCVFFLVGLVVLRPSAALAEAGPFDVVLAQGAASANEPFSLSGMLPGDEEAIDVAVDVRHECPLRVHFKIDPVECDSPLSGALMLRIEDAATGAVVCEGALDQLTKAAPVAIEVPESETGVTRLSWRVVAKLPPSAGNENQSARCVVDLHWFVQGDDQASLAPLPKTGDPLLPILVVLAVVAGVAVIVWRFGRARRGKVLACAVALAVSVGAVGAFAWAAFGAHAKLPFNLFETGTVSIELNEGRPVFSDGVPLEAGRTATEEFTVSNTGTADVRYRIYLADVTGDLAASLEFTIRRGDDVLFCGSAAELERVDACVSDAVLAPGHVDVLTASVRLLPAAVGDGRGQSASFDLCAQATQVKNNEGGAF